jgi:predicted phosphoribosyltransferase
MERPFLDRREAGRILAERLKKYAGMKDAMVLGLPRGGVVVAYEVAETLGLPLDVFVVRKIGLPGQEEFAIGALASGGTCVVDEVTARLAGVSTERLERVVQNELKELCRRERLYREGRPLDLADKIVLVVDDGLATGSTMQAAVVALKKRGVRKIVVAVPVGSEEACSSFKDEADETICAVIPKPFYAVGVWYDDFRQTTDEEVRSLLHRAHLPTEKA